ncbi:MAG: hypothetical protein H6540_06340 [Bacteroidales bacterium]|nr:hypothetical protein [Bacteroidales bacterium]
MVVLDDTDCMVDIAATFFPSPRMNPGKCTFCRWGQKNVRNTYKKITSGRWQGKKDLEELENWPNGPREMSLRIQVKQLRIRFINP